MARKRARADAVASDERADKSQAPGQPRPSGPGRRASHDRVGLPRKGATLPSVGRLVLLARRRARPPIPSERLKDTERHRQRCIRGRGAGNATYGSFSAAC